MAMLDRNTYNAPKRVVDLSGPEGNAFCLMGLASNLCKQLELDKDAVLNEMKSGDYDNLVSVFDSYFGNYVDLLK